MALLIQTAAGGGRRRREKELLSSQPRPWASQSAGSWRRHRGCQPLERDHLSWPIHDDGYAGKTQEPTDKIETVWRDMIDLPTP